MPEAVIVDAVRTPIGRAVKGSLKDVRADDLAAIPLKALVERNPEVDFSETDDLMMGCGFQAGEQGYNIGRNARCWRGSTITSRPRPSTASAPPRCRRSAWRSTRSRPARATLHRRRRRGRLALRGGQLPVPPAARRLGGLAVQRLHPDGPDRRERRRALQGLPRVPGRVGRDLAAARGRGPRDRTTSTPRSSPVSARRHRGHQGRRPAPRHDDREARRAQAGVQARRHGHGRQRLPAERRRRRGARHVRRPREKLGLKPRARIVATPSPPSAPRSWASARSRRSRRSSSRPA